MRRRIVQPKAEGEEEEASAAKGREGEEAVYSLQ